MSDEEKMTIDERRKYLRKMQQRYRKAERREKGQLLDEMEQVTELQRKYLIELLKGDLKRKRRRTQRGRRYGLEVDDVLRVIHSSFDYICAERLTPNLVWMAQHLARHGELDISDEVLEKLGGISISTVGRILGRIGQDRPRLPRKKPGQSRKWLQNIPMTRIPWDTATPGHFEVDLVHHCGSTASGDYMSTLQMIDVATGWSERVAVLGRSYLVMEHAFKTILRRLPFPVREIHPDNGSEFLNQHMLCFWGKLVQGVQLSRSRPYQKNDNRNVEQKNSTLVRAFLGHDRLDSVAQTLATNRLYEMMWIYYNLFQPVMHLKEKQVICPEGQAKHVIRRHDDARTPFDRLCATDYLIPEHRTALAALRDQINPRLLRQQIYDALAAIFALPCAPPGKAQDVRLSLVSPHYSDNGNGQRSLLDFAFNCTEIAQS